MKMIKSTVNKAVRSESCVLFYFQFDETLLLETHMKSGFNLVSSRISTNPFMELFFILKK